MLLLCLIIVVLSVKKKLLLTPLEETVAGKELIQMGWQREQQEGQKRGVEGLNGVEGLSETCPERRQDMNNCPN